MLGNIVPFMGKKKVGRPRKPKPDPQFWVPQMKGDKKRFKSYSLKEAAKLMGIAYVTVKKWVTEGRIKVIPYGSHKRVPYDEMVRISLEGIPTTYVPPMLRKKREMEAQKQNEMSNDED